MTGQTPQIAVMDHVGMKKMFVSRSYTPNDKRILNINHLEKK